MTGSRAGPSDPSLIQGDIYRGTYLLLLFEHRVYVVVPFILLQIADHERVTEMAIPLLQPVLADHTGCYQLRDFLGKG